MKKIYTDTDIIKMGYYKSVLESNGIPVYIKNEALSGLAGAIPSGEVWPELWVMNDKNTEKAVSLLNGIENNTDKDLNDE